MIDNKTKQLLLDKILASKEFKSSNITQKLLRFLIENSIAGNTSNENIIATEVFDRDVTFNSNEDTIVRVSIHNLRKKLELYYNKEGKHDSVRIEIPKGHYDITYTQVSKKKIIQLLSDIKFLFILTITVLILIVCIQQVKINSLNNNIGEKGNIISHHFWKNILQSESEKMIVLGDDFFFHAGDPRTDDDGKTIIRRYFIENINDLKKNPVLLKKYPKFKIPNFVFVPSISIYPLQYILPMLSPNHIIPIKYSSKLSSNDILNKDVLFLGTFRNLHILTMAVDSRISDYQYQEFDRSFKITTPDTLKVFHMDGFPDEQHIDYCYIAKIPGPNQNNIHVFITFFETAMIGAVQYMTDHKKLEELEQMFINKFGVHPEYFEVLIKTSGHSRMAFNTSIVHFDKIEKEEIVW